MGYGLEVVVVVGEFYRSSIGVRRVYQWFYCVPLVFLWCYLASLKASNDTIGYTLGILYYKDCMVLKVDTEKRLNKPLSGVC